MKFNRYHYSLSVSLELTGAELEALILCSQHHYDGTCQAAAEQGGFLFGAYNGLVISKAAAKLKVPMGLKKNSFTKYPELRDLKFEHTFSSREIDLMQKILEEAERGFKTYWKTEEEQNMVCALWMEVRRRNGADSREGERLQEWPDDRTKALMVISKDHKIRAWLLENDPQALKQVDTAIAGFPDGHPVDKHTAVRYVDLQSERSKVADAAIGESDMLGYEVETSDGWEHETGSDEIACSLFVKNEADEDGDSIKMRMSVKFKPRTAEIESASIEGEDVPDICKVKA